MPYPECVVVTALPPNEQIRLMDRAVPRTLRRGQSIFLAGEAAERVYIVTSGLLKVCARDASGSETILGLAGPGDLTGETGAFERTHSYDAVAVTRTEVLALDAALFIDVVTAHPKAALELSRTMADRWRRMSEVALERTTAQVPVRLAGRLLDLAELCGHMQQGTIVMQLPLGQEDLGRWAGMCRESTCKTLRKFKRAGVVDYKGRTLRILRPDVLEKIRCAGRDAAPSR